MIRRAFTIICICLTAVLLAACGTTPAEYTVTEIDSEADTGYYVYRINRPETSSPPAPTDTVGGEKTEPSQTPETDVLFPETSYGTAGRLVSSIGLNVPLFRIDETNVGVSQRIVDDENSAGYLAYSWLKQPIICDHSYQGFRVLNTAVPGETTVAIKSEAKPDVIFRLTGSFAGRNDSFQDLLDGSGNSVIGELEGDLLIYTCLDNERNILITVWERIEG